MILIFLSVLAAGALLLVGVLLLWSPGSPTPFTDENGSPLPGSLSEKIHVNINGVEQGMFIKSKDETNPVLLFLHGGPGMPEYFLTQPYPTGLEEDFTVCWWEQRGSGLSYRPDLPPETMTVDQLVADTLEVTNYLRNRFGKEKIYLMAHSWGSFIGIQAAARAPELYHAYLGMSQISHQIESERLAYEYMLQRFKEAGNTRMVRKLEGAPVTITVPLPRGYDALRDGAMHSLGIGTTHDMKSVVSGIFLPVWQFREYTLGEKVNIWRGKLYSRSFNLWDTMLATDMLQKVPELELPTYFFQGIHDYTVAYPVTKAYFEKLKAPLKGFYTFEQSAHSPLFEEPEKMRYILQQDILEGTNRLADTE
jgi:pimeloyl-ACP methyl ester carboxylesterase